MTIDKDLSTTLFLIKPQFFLDCPVHFSEFVIDFKPLEQLNL